MKEEYTVPPRVADSIRRSYAVQFHDTTEDELTRATKRLKPHQRSALARFLDDLAGAQAAKRESAEEVPPEEQQTTRPTTKRRGGRGLPRRHDVRGQARAGRRPQGVPR